MTADDSMKSQCAQSGMKGRVGVFQNQGVCLQAFPSFPSPTPSFLFLLSPHFRAGKTPKPPFFAFSSLFASRKRLLRRLQFRQRTGFGSSRKLRGPSEHLIDGSEKRICRLSFNFSVRVLLKSAVIVFVISNRFVSF